jgi:hypothetical protein
MVQVSLGKKQVSISKITTVKRLRGVDKAIDICLTSVEA